MPSTIKLITPGAGGPGTQRAFIELTVSPDQAQLPPTIRYDHRVWDRVGASLNYRPLNLAIVDIEPLIVES